MVWVLYCWVTRLVQRACDFRSSYQSNLLTETQSHAFAHLLFALCVGLCAYNFFRAVTLDPGTCPKPTSDAELKSIIEDLASEGRLNGQTFCIQCMVRAPRFLPPQLTLFARRASPCARSIAGCARNEQLTTFAVFSSIALPIESDPSAPVPSSSCPLPASLCVLTATDSFLVSVAVWATLQLSWTSVLLASQFWQIARQMTTLEVSNLGRYGFMGGRGGASLNGQMGHRHAHGSAQAPEADGDSSGAPPKPSGFIMNLLGLDRFTRGKAVDGLARAGRASNPFDLGAYRNCRDFWSKGRELGVEYERLYDVPLEGFEEARRRREREEEEDGLSAGGAGRKGARKGLFMGLSMGMGRAGSSRAGYEPVNQTV
ncbi:hypothetical protein DFH07DRAFT_757939 [Mycena maculata]|uniref:Uncharacterized protein n=1 Tax=Mycena maculata TaxID=230809 RepID=A0AAD7MPF3_9AGAR|nr:hypothetical protein DFH07DRAFT_757939 [Mycena maculata]